MPDQEATEPIAGIGYCTAVLLLIDAAAFLEAGPIIIRA